MKRVIFEGTDQQIENLIQLLSNKVNDLPELKSDYQTANLWTIHDVTDRYNCTDDEAMTVLEDALTNDATIEQIHFTIQMKCDEMGFKTL